MESDLFRARSMAYEGDIAALLPHKKNGEQVNSWQVVQPHCNG